MILRDDQIDAEVHERIKAAARGPDPYVRYLARRITKVRAPVLRAAATAYAVHELARGIEVRTLYTRMQGIAVYLNHTGATDLDGLTATAFRDHFGGLEGNLGPQVWYERQRHVQAFLGMHLGAEEAKRRAPAAKANSDWHSNRPPWYAWEDLRKVWLRLDLQERAQFALLAGTGAGADEVRTVPVSALSFEGADGLAVVALPATRKREPREVAPIFGEKSLAALARLSKEATRTVKWVFPDPKDPGKPMDRHHLSYRLRTWAKRAGLEDLTASRLQGTVVCYMLGRGVSPEVVAHLMGVKLTKRIERLKDQVRLAREQGHPAGQPAFHSDAPAPGLVSCEVCGRMDNSADAMFCAGCGAQLREDALDEESLLKADMQRRFRRLLDLTGESPAQRVAAALAAVATAEAAPEEVPA